MLAMPNILRHLVFNVLPFYPVFKIKVFYQAIRYGLPVQFPKPAVRHKIGRIIWR